MKPEPAPFPNAAVAHDIGSFFRNASGRFARRRTAPQPVSYVVHAGTPPLARPAPLYPTFKRRLSEPAFYIVPAMMWLVLSARYGSTTLPTVANPGMEAGGLWGESKMQGLQLFGPVARRHTARTVAFDAPAACTAEFVRRTMQAAGLSFPVIAKPDRGYQGWGVRKLANEQGLADYLAAMPAEAKVILQEYVPFAGEAGVFYVRHPGEAQGRIFSMALVYAPHVIGDGRQTLADLVAENPVLRKNAATFKAARGLAWSRVVPKGKVVSLAESRSARLGAVYRDAREHVTVALERRIDEIARDIPGFHFGRFDIRFASLDRLKAGEDFAIVELNGAGSEILRVWDGNTRLVEAYRGLWQQYATLFAIAATNRKAGCRPAPPTEMIRLLRRQESLRRAYPAST